MHYGQTCLKANFQKFVQKKMQKIRAHFQQVERSLTPPIHRFHFLVCARTISHASQTIFYQLILRC